MDCSRQLDLLDDEPPGHHGYGVDTICLFMRLEKDSRWQEFQRQIGQTRCAVQQTELAFLAPPAPKPKARFMNLQPQLEWADGVLDILREPPAKVLQWVSPERLQEKLGWLREFTEPVSE